MITYIITAKYTGNPLEVFVAERLRQEFSVTPWHQENRLASVGFFSGEDVHELRLIVDVLYDDHGLCHWTESTLQRIFKEVPAYPATLIHTTADLLWTPPGEGAMLCEVNHTADRLTPGQVQVLFGQRVQVYRRLKSTYVSGFKRWYSVPVAKVGGIFIGVRTLQQGRREFEDGWYFRPSGYFQAALVATDPRRRPVLVPISEVTYCLPKEEP